MSIQDRIVYDGNELIQILEGTLDKFNVFRFDHRYRELVGDELIRKINTWDTNIRKQKDSPLTLVVCGEFKRGKSSLINAILGAEVVTTDVTTETITTNKISYGAHKNEIILSGGRRVALADDELKSEKLKMILAGLPEEASRLELKRPLDILKQVTIIDTPGLGDASKDFSADVEQALAQADAVIYVFSVAYPLSVNEQLFIKTVIKPQKYTELFLVGNMTDMLEDQEDCGRMREVLENRLENILPDETPHMLSALDEQCRQSGSARPNPDLKDFLEANFRDFRNQLTELLESKRDCILPDRIQRLICGMVQDVGQDLDALSQGLSMDAGQVSAKMERLKAHREEKIREQTEIDERIDDLIELYHGRTTEWIEDFLSKMEHDVINLADISTDDIKRYYVMYCIDTVQEAMKRCMEHCTVELYDELDDISADISRKMSLRIDSAPIPLSFSLQNKTWTRGDNVAFASDVIGMSGGWLGIAINYVAGSMRQKQVKDSRPDLINEIKEQYSPLRISVFKTIKESFKNLGEKAKEQTGIYFEEQLRNLELQVEQSAMVARQDDAKKQEIRAALDELQAILDEIEADIKNIG